MKLVDRQVTRELTGPFLFGVAAFSSVIFAITVMIKLTQWLSHGMPVLMAIEGVILSVPGIMYYTLPMSTLLAVLMGIGRLSGESEIVALFAGGVSLYRIALPILGLGLVVSGFSLVLDEIVTPRANVRISELEKTALKQTPVSEKPFTVEDPGTSSVINVRGGMDMDNAILRDVTITQYVKNQPVLFVYAARAQWAGINNPALKYRWKLYDGRAYAVDLKDPRSIAITTFTKGQSREVMIQKTRDDLALYRNLKAELMTFSQLSKMVGILKEHPDRDISQIRDLEVWKWNKLSVPLSCLVFALLAAPLGIRPHRSSSSVGLGLSILVILIFYVAGRYTWNLALNGTLMPATAAFIPDALGVITAGVLLKRAAK